MHVKPLPLRYWVTPLFREARIRGDRAILWALIVSGDGSIIPDVVIRAKEMSPGSDWLLTVCPRYVALLGSRELRGVIEPRDCTRIGFSSWVETQYGDNPRRRSTFFTIG